MLKYSIIILVFISITLSSKAVAGGPPPPPGGGGGPACWPPPCIPIDGGISLLIAAGVAYGGKKIYENNKKTHENEHES